MRVLGFDVGDTNTNDKNYFDPYIKGYHLPDAPDESQPPLTVVHGEL